MLLAPVVYLINSMSRILHADCQLRRNQGLPALSLLLPRVLPFPPLFSLFSQWRLEQNPMRENGFLLIANRSVLITLKWAITWSAVHRKHALARVCLSPSAFSTWVLREGWWDTPPGRIQVISNLRIHPPRSGPCVSGRQLTVTLSSESLGQCLEMVLVVTLGGWEGAPGI